jgi:hemoglobin
VSSVPAPAAGAESAAQTPYAMLGGEAAVRALVERFYDLMDLEPEYAAIRQLHAADLALARGKLYLFLSGWLGGPSLYIERYGPPMLRARHLPFPIGTRERDQWMACMMQAMVEQGLAEELRQRLLQAFFPTADWMRNRTD